MVAQQVKDPVLLLLRLRFNPGLGTSACHRSREKKKGSSHCGTAETNPTRNHENEGSILGLTQWVEDPV